MPTPSRPYEDWPKATAVLALIVTALGAVFAAFWGLIAGLWTFSTKEYGDFSLVVAVAIILISTPIFSFKAASEGKHRLASALTIPALLLYATVLLAFLAR